MVGLYYGKHFTESYIRDKLPQHAFGNWLPEMAIFLENEGIKTKIYTNSPEIPVNNKEKPTLSETFTAYGRIGEITIALLNKNIFGTTPSIINVNRSALYNKHKGKVPHYIVVIRKEYSLLVYDPLSDDPILLSIDQVLKASINMNRNGNNGLLLLSI